MTPMQGHKHDSNVSKIYEKFRNFTALSTRNELYKDNKNKKETYIGHTLKNMKHNNCYN